MSGDTVGSGMGGMDPTQRDSRGGGKGATGPTDLPDIPEVTLTDEIGRGGMGVVYRGRQEYLDRDVAVKFLIVDANDSDYAARFQREAKILAGLAHPNIVTCYSAGITADNKPYIVMEFIDGPNLAQWLSKLGPVVPRLALEIVRDIAEALRHGYRSNIIHRDVKAENVLLSRKVAASVGAAFPYDVKLADLGLARPVTREDTMMNLTSNREVLGTPPMMAPEQFEDTFSIDHRADIYGLACVLFQMLTGQSAFTGRSYAAIIAKKQSPRGPDPRSLKPDVPEAVADLVTEMLARDPDDRPQTYEVLIRRIDGMITALDSGLALPSSVDVFHDGKTQVIERPPTTVLVERKPIPKPLIAVAGVVLLAILIAVLWPRGATFTAVGPQSVGEGDPIWLQIEGDDVAAAEVRWSLTRSGSEPTIELPAAGDRLNIVAPNWHQDYDLEFVWVVKPADGGDHQTGSIVVNVAAKNDPPTVTVQQSYAARAGTTLTVQATGDDPEGGTVRFDWQAVDGKTVNWEKREAGASLSLSLPDSETDYTVTLSVTPVDSEGAAGGAKTVRIDVGKALVALEVAIVDLDPVAEGEPVRLEASVTGGNPAGRTFRWRQTSGPEVRLQGQTKPLATFTACSRLTAAADLVFQLEVSDSDPSASRSDTVTVKVRPDDRFFPMTAAGKSLFAGKMNKILEIWTQRGQPFDKSDLVGDGVWGSGTADSESVLTYDGMPRGDWRLTGFLDDVTVPQPATSHGIRLELVESRHFIRFGIERADAESPRHLHIYEEVRSGGDKLTRVSHQSVTLSANGYLHFRLTYRDGNLLFQYHDAPSQVYKGNAWEDNEESLDRKSLPGRMRPRLSVYVGGAGIAKFHEFSLSGVK